MKLSNVQEIVTFTTLLHLSTLLKGVRYTCLNSYDLNISRLHEVGYRVSNLGN